MGNNTLQLARTNSYFNLPSLDFQHFDTALTRIAYHFYVTVISAQIGRSFLGGSGLGFHFQSLLQTVG